MRRIAGMSVGQIAESVKKEHDPEALYFTPEQVRTEILVARVPYWISREFEHGWDFLQYEVEFLFQGKRTPLGAADLCGQAHRGLAMNPSCEELKNPLVYHAKRAIYGGVYMPMRYPTGTEWHFYVLDSLTDG